MKTNINYILYGTIFILVGVSTGQHDHDHDHGDESSFQEVQEFFSVSGPTLPYEETNLLIRHILYRIGCGQQAGVDCFACLRTDTVLSYFNRTNVKSLDEESFHQLSVILTVFIRNPVQECSNSETTLGPGGRTFNEFLEILSEDYHHEEDGHDHHAMEEPPHLNLHKIEDILHDIKAYHQNGHLKLARNGSLLDGPYINYNETLECIYPEEIYEHLSLPPDTEVTGETIEDVTALLITRILQGYCINTMALPSKQNFLVSIFQRYANNISWEIPPEVFESMITSLGLTSEMHEEEGGDGDHDHDHSEHAKARKRREISRTLARRIKRETGHEHEITNVDKSCYSSEQLLMIFLGNSSSSVDTSSFVDICPAVLQQLLAGTCSHKEEKLIALSTVAEAYGYGTLSVFIITCCTLLGAIFVNIKNVKVKRRMMSFLMSIAIGTLLGDSLLHLIPEATGIHGDHDDHAHGSSEIVIEPYVWKMMALLSSLYAFFILELLMSKPSSSHTHDISDDKPGFDVEISSEKKDIYQDSKEDSKEINKALVLMICVGDGLHNFADGMAIGAAFALSVTGGISSSLAIICHEIPHELGDFAALVNGGLSVKKALIMNFMSGCTAFIGLYIGISLGEHPESRIWIFIIAAGMFIYVAMADLIPEIMTIFKTSNDSVIIFICINIGFLFGFGIMFCIAIFESQIKID